MHDDTKRATPVVVHGKTTFSDTRNKNSESREIFQIYEDKGKRILEAAMLVVIWSFSIDVKLRRVHFCFTEACEANLSRCYDCVTFGEWIDMVKEYYKNGGRVFFDFSIDPNPK